MKTLKKRDIGRGDIARGQKLWLFAREREFRSSTYMRKVLDAKICRAVLPSPRRKEEMLCCFQHLKVDLMEN